jgi:hypothetical protein
MGNLLGNPNVGMLFINFEKPHRLRLSAEFCWKAGPSI